MTMIHVPAKFEKNWFLIAFEIDLKEFFHTNFLALFLFVERADAA